MLDSLQNLVILPADPINPDLHKLNPELENADEEVEEPRTLLQTLAAMEANDSPSQPALFIAVNNIQNIALAPGAPAFSPPVAINASLALPDDIPHLTARLDFNTDDDAARFLEIWPELKKILSSYPLPGLVAILDSAGMTQSGNALIVTAHSNPTTVTLLLMLAKNILK